MIQHDTRPCTPSSHSAYRGYDATTGKLATFARNSKGYACPDCLRRFFTPDQLRQHRCRPEAA